MEVVSDGLMKCKTCGKEMKAEYARVSQPKKEIGAMKKAFEKLFILLMVVIQFVIKWARFSFVAVFLYKVAMLVIAAIKRWLGRR